MTAYKTMDVPVPAGGENPTENLKPVLPVTGSRPAGRINGEVI